MGIQVEGDRNRVAGRDYHEGNTHLQLNIHGDNYAPIAVGTSDRVTQPKPIHQWTVEELYTALAYYRAQWWSGFRGYWLNTPCLALLGLLFGMGSSLYAGVLPFHDPKALWLVLMLFLLAFAGLGFWLAYIRRIESRVMDESGTAVDEIRTELRRRR